MPNKHTFTVPLPENYRPQDALRRIGNDPECRDEQIGIDSFTKAFPVLTTEGVVLLRLVVVFTPRQAEATIEGDFTLSPELILSVKKIAHRLLGLTIDPVPFEERAKTDSVVRRLVGKRSGLRIALTATVFEGVVWAILGQQVNVSFAATLRRRLINLCGSPAGEGYTAHPTPAQVAQLDYADLTPHQISQRKAEYLIDTARLVVAGELPLETLDTLPFSEAEAKLLAVRGFGPWSTHYLLMRSCGFPDCVPLGDTGLREAVRRFFALDHAPTPAEVAEHTAGFAPYRSLATFHLWHSLSDPVEL